MSRALRCLLLGCSAAIVAACADGAPTSPVIQRKALVAAPYFSKGHGGPTHEPSPGSFLDFPAGVVCSFELLGEPLANNGKATTFPAAANGDVEMLITGTYVERLSNASTGKSIVENLSGPLHFTFHTDGSATLVLTGRTQLFFGSADIPAGPRAYINSGRAEVTLSPDGTETLVSQSGEQTDICAALQ